jgi:hypothetical protein
MRFGISQQRDPGLGVPFLFEAGNLNVTLALKGVDARFRPASFWRRHMHGIIYLVGLIVVIMAILSFFGLR